MKLFNLAPLIAVDPRKKMRSSFLGVLLALPLTAGGAAETALSTPCPGFSRTQQDIAVFGIALQEAVGAAKRKLVASMLRYPLRVNEGPGRPRDIESEESFLMQYESVVTASVKAQIEAMTPKDVFCKDDSAMLGHGIVWLTEDDEAAIKVRVINK